jgi:hypothetical protein
LRENSYAAVAKDVRARLLEELGGGKKPGEPLATA